MRASRFLLPTVLVVVAVASTAWLLVTVIDMHDRLAKHSDTLALVFIIVSGLTAVVSAAVAALFFWKIGRGERAPAQAPEDVVKAAEVQTEKAEGVIAQVRDESARVDLQKEIAALRADRQKRQFHVVVFGTGSAGKTSLINALLGRHVGKTEAVMGTTRHGETHTRTVEGVDGTVLLTDTPGLSEIGAGGAEREREARDLATRADLLIFVVDHDLTRSEFDPLVALARQGKRSVVVLNKCDRLADADRDTILDKLRERLRGVVPPQDVVSVSASPRPTLVRVKNADGTTGTAYESQPPDIDALDDRIAAVLAREGDALRAGNLLLRAHLIARRARDVLARERDARAQAVVDKFQWITAATVFTNPIPALDLMATGAVQFQMISELAGVYGVEITSAHVKMIGTQMIQMLLKLGMVEATTSLIAGLFKSSLVGYAAGGAVQCVSMAYLTHISGLTFREYFARGQSWGDGGMQAALIRQFDLNSRAEFLQEFAKQAFDKVINKALRGKETEQAGTNKGG
jgi:small GTP-binding protein